VAYFKVGIHIYVETGRRKWPALKCESREEEFTCFEALIQNFPGEYL
jgi:hypothetical protein